MKEPSERIVEDINIEEILEEAFYFAVTAYFSEDDMTGKVGLGRSLVVQN